MFKVAAPRTIWVSANDKPVQDLTELIDNHYKEIEKVVEGIWFNRANLLREFNVKWTLINKNGMYT